MDECLEGVLVAAPEGFDQRVAVRFVASIEVDELSG
jgi:hypothetical protein